MTAPEIDPTLPDWLRERLTRPLDLPPDAGHAAREARFPDATPAAVLVPLIWRESPGADDEPVGWWLVFTRRTMHVRTHRGQIAFPGGRTDPGDRDAADTALRETTEEIGLSRDQITILGELPTFVTISAYRVTPVVGLLRGPLEALDCTLSADETDEVLAVPLGHLLDPAHHEIRLMPAPDAPPDATTHEVHFHHYRQHTVWGATAAMLQPLLALLREMAR